MCITVDKMRQITETMDSKVTQVLGELHGNEQAEIDIWGARLEDRLPRRAREGLVNAFLSQFGFEAAYGGQVKRILDDTFCVLPKACNTLRKAIAHSELAIHETFMDSEVGKLSSRMLEVMKDRRGCLRANERVWANWQAVAERLEQFDDSPALNDVDRQEKRDLLAYVESGFSRTMPRLPATSKLLALGRKYPNFSKAVHYLAGQFALARMSGAGFPHIPPILLLGAPGTGKTMFAHALAKCLATEVLAVGMSSQSAGFGLAGLDRGWSSARPGAVFNALRHGGSLAPVFILDEIDKASVDSRTNPLGALYTLLEPNAAVSFVDEYAGFAVDASAVVWVATANDKRGIPDALLSRFVVFEIEAPTVDQMALLANEIYRKAAGKLPLAPRHLPKAWLQQLAGYTPREMRLAIQQALGRAALRSVMGQPLCLASTDLMMEPPEEEGKKCFGFLG